MALFKKRSSSSAADSDTTPESAAAYADPIRRRARHRLIGASVLVGVAVLVLPWIFDVKPPTVSANVPIAIDGQSETPPAPSAQVAQAPVRAAEPEPADETPAASERTPERDRCANDDTDAPAPAAKPAPAAAEPATRAPETRQAAAPKATPTTPAPTARKPANTNELTAQRQAQTQASTQTREKKPSPAPNKPAAANTAATKTEQAKQQPPVEYNFPEKGRFVVQIGAYVEADRVANVRRRLSQAGLNNYTQKVTIDGKQVTRVRIGPFTSRKQMEQVASKVRALGLPVSLYQL